MTAVFDLDISPAEKLVLLAMAHHAHDDGAGCYPAVDTLARKTSLTDRGVQKIMRRLERAGLIELLGSRKGGRASSAEYRVVPRKGEYGSPSKGEKRVNLSAERVNAMTERANLSAKKGEPCSPESSGIIIQPSLNRQRRQAQAKSQQPSPSAFSGVHVEVSSRQDQRLAEAFPWADRAAEYRKIDSWLEANPNRRPRNAGRFLHNWFSRIPANSKEGGSNRAEERTRANLKAAGFIQ
jgi:hypothetical protein